MRNFGCLLALILILVVFAAPPADARKPALGQTLSSELEIDGKTRHYVVHVPNACKGRKSPLVLLLHGGLTSSKYVAFESRFSEKADRENFIVAYPEGSGGLGRQLLTWNAGDCCGPAQWKARNDVGFIRELIARLQKEYEIDSDRIYVAGVSNGGMMAFRIAGELSDTVAAIAAVNGCLQDDELKLRKPISILAVNGSKDKVIRLNGGTGSMLGYKITCPDVRETMKRFAREMGCNAEPQKETIGRGSRETYKGGPGGAEVCLYSLPISHFWSSGRRPFPTFNLLKNEASATDIIWDFFKAHPKSRGV